MTVIISTLKSCYSQRFLRFVYTLHNLSSADCELHQSELLSPVST